MQSLRVLAWVCSLAGLFCGSLARPDLAALQLTYDQEEAQGSTLHDKGLRIVEASCEAPSRTATSGTGSTPIARVRA